MELLRTFFVLQPDKVKELLEECETKNPQYLNLSFCGLTHLPKIPDTVRVLVCGANPLTELSNLPPALVTLICCETNIESLPPLPDTLQTLWCCHTPLTSLPPLPKQLKSLWIHKTGIQIVDCPPELNDLQCDPSLKILNLPKDCFVFEKRRLVFEK